MKIKTRRYYYNKKYRYTIVKDYQDYILIFYDLFAEEEVFIPETGVKMWVRHPCLYGTLDKERTRSALRALLQESEFTKTFLCNVTWEEITRLIKKHKT